MYNLVCCSFNKACFDKIYFFNRELRSTVTIAPSTVTIAPKKHRCLKVPYFVNACSAYVMQMSDPIPNLFDERWGSFWLPLSLLRHHRDFSGLCEVWAEHLCVLFTSNQVVFHCFASPNFAVGKKELVRHSRKQSVECLGSCT